MKLPEELFDEMDRFRKVCDACKERLGPGGFRIIEKYIAYKEALEFYADPDHYMWFDFEEGYTPEDVVEDGGKRARIALGKPE